MCPVGSIDGSSSRGGMLGTQDRGDSPRKFGRSFDRVHHPGPACLPRWWDGYRHPTVGHTCA